MPDRVQEAAAISVSGVRASVLDLLQEHWHEDRGYCVPNPNVYPHLWLWDSCFHAVVWAYLDDARALRELDATLAGQLDNGLVPHMRYGGQPDTFLGPLDDTSSLAQPPMFGHAIKVLLEHGVSVPESSLRRARRGLEWLWLRRRLPNGLLYVVHPWEAGNDHSPRWDDWGAPGRTSEDYDRPARTAWNKAIMRDVSFDADGAAIWSSRFVACPAGFNAYVAFNLRELGEATDDAELMTWASDLASAADEHLWSSDEGMWCDLAVIGGGPSVRVPISDGLMGALVTADRQKAETALDLLTHADRFAAPFGPSNVARSHPAYDPATYWRGPAWPNISYLLWLALKRWHLTDQAEDLAVRTCQGAIRSGWSEYWNPETGEGLGARPQSWTGLVWPMVAER